MKTIELEAKRIGISIMSAEYETLSRRDHIGMELIHRFSAYVMSEKQPPFTYQTPATWWDAFKQSHFPQWALKQWPAKVRTHTISLELLWPQLRTALPPHVWGPRVTLLINDRPTYSFMPDHEPISSIEWNRKTVDISLRNILADGRKCPCCERLFREES